jgi:hypothetical protein
MPLNSAALQSGILAVCSSPGPSVAACAQQWADAMGNYASGVIPPSLTVDAAKSALVGALTSAFATFAPPAMETAFAAFAATVGAGMAPGFVATPPPRPVGFAALAAPPAPLSHADAAARTATLIDTWMRSATATPAAGGSPSPWQ